MELILILVIVIAVFLIWKFVRAENERAQQDVLRRYTPIPQAPPSRTPEHLPAFYQSFGKFSGVAQDKVVQKKDGVIILDLHEMRVKEAVQVTKDFLEQYRGRYQKGQIITGRGLHSVDGVPRIKIAVENLLTQSGIEYTIMAKGGCLEVYLA